MKLFSGMTFPRWVIVTMLLASSALGWLVYHRFTRLDEVRYELRRVEGVVSEIQELALQLNGLQDLASKEGLKGENDPELYIREIAVQDKVGIGQVGTTPSRQTPFKGVEDHRFKIKPLNKNKRYSRGQIGNFLYKLEADSRRVRVTSLKLTPVERIRPGETGDDTWTFEAEITSRQKAE